MKRRFLISLQIFALVLGLGLTVLVSLVFHELGLSFAAIPTAGAYLALIWSAFRGNTEQDWLRAATGWLLKLALPTFPRVIATVLVLALANAYFGLWLQRLHLRPNFHLHLYERNPAAPARDVTVEMQSVEPRAVHTASTDELGIASFRLDRQQLYLCFIVRHRDGDAWRTGLASKIQIEDRLLLKDLASIPEDQWELQPQYAIEVSGSRPGALARLGEAFRDLVPEAKSAPPTDETQRRLARHLPFGLPAAPLVAAREDYVLGFDPARKSALWVAYKMNPGDDTPRANRMFSPDADLDPALQVSETAYRNSGFDRGHLISRRDIAGTGGDVDAIVGRLSLVVPQYPDFNRRIWTRFEEFCRTLAEDAEVWILTGPVYPGAGEELRTIGEGILVPAAIFRIVVRKLPDGRFQAGAFLVPNADRLDFTDVRQFSLPIEALETKLGLKLLMVADPAQREELKSTAYPW